MQFLANENIPLPSVTVLRQAGYDVAYIVHDSPGIEDAIVLSRAVQEKRVILTFDRDYGELIYRLRLPVPMGIIYFRFRPKTPDEAGQLLLSVLSMKDIQLEGNFTVLERDQIRQRPLP